MANLLKLHNQNLMHVINHTHTSRKCLVPFNTIFTVEQSSEWTTTSSTRVGLSSKLVLGKRLYWLNEFISKFFATLVALQGIVLFATWNSLGSYAPTGLLILGGQLLAIAFVKAIVATKHLRHTTGVRNQLTEARKEIEKERKESPKAEETLSATFDATISFEKAVKAELPLKKASVVGHVLAVIGLVSLIVSVTLLATFLFGGVGIGVAPIISGISALQIAIWGSSALLGISLVVLTATKVSAFIQIQREKTISQQIPVILKKLATAIEDPYSIHTTSSQ